MAGGGSGLHVGLLVAAGAALTAALADRSPDRPGEPSGSLHAGETSAPDGTHDLSKATDNAPLAVGRIRILPAGSVPSYDWGFFPTNTKVETGVDFLDPAQVARGLTLGVRPDVVAPPPGFKLSFGGANLNITTDDIAYISGEFYRFTREGQLPIQVLVRLIKPGASVELVDYEPAAGHALDALELHGVQMVVQHGTPDAQVQPISAAWFVAGDYLVEIEAVAPPPATFQAFLDAFAADQPARLATMSEMARGAAHMKGDRP